jgi:hypothetical protein
MSEEKYLSLREIMSEVTIRDLLLFICLFIFSIGQNWNNIFLFLFPIITFGFALFFRLIGTNKDRLYAKENLILYNPMGSEKRHANRLSFCSLLLLIFLFWFGAESIYHPQLVNNYFPYFVSFFIFIYTFGYFWIFIDLWKFAAIKVVSLEGEMENLEFSESILDTQNLISFLNLKKFQVIAIMSLVIFLIMNILNILLTVFNLIPSMPMIVISLPGTGIEGSQAIILSSISYIILILPPIYAILSLSLIYKNITSFSKENLYNIVENFPGEIQNNIIENLKSINKKLINSQKME